MKRGWNPIDVRDGYAMIDVSTNTHPEIYAIVDIDDLEMVSRHAWAATLRKKALYVRGIVNGSDVMLHRFIMQPPSHMEIDHIDGNPLNNRRSNLRICTAAQNTIFGADRRRGGPKPPTKETSIVEWRKWREQMRKRGRP